MVKRLSETDNGLSVDQLIRTLGWREAVMFYSRMWGSCGTFGRPFGHEVMWSAYLNGLLSVDLENMPEDADADPHVGMRPSLSPPPLDAPSPAKGCLPPPHEGTHLTNGTSKQHLNGAAMPHVKEEEQKIEEYLQRSDTAVIFPEPVGGVKKEGKEAEELKVEPGSPEPVPVIEEPKVLSEYLLKCPHCEQVFSGQQAIHELKDHLDLNHKEVSPPDPAFVCQKCNATFPCKENLAKHKLFHVSNGQGSAVSTDENAQLRKFKCTECGKAFKFKHHLKEHIRIHSGEKPFACPNCGKRFSHSGSYSSHMTSKKCLVVNLKVRKVDSRSPRGRGTAQNNSFRPIIPKYASTVANGNGPAPDMQLLPAGYMPPSERFGPGFGGPARPQQPPYLPLTFHPLLTSAPHYLPLGAFPEVTQLLQRRFENDCSPGQDHPPQPSPHQLPAPSPFQDKTEDSLDSSPKPAGEMNAVKKILEIVDATVSKQQQSPTRPRNGLLSELLSSSPHPIVKTPPPPVLGSRSLLDTRCRYCSRLFDSKIDLYQHERYTCPHNFEARTRAGPSERYLPDSNHASDGESGGDDDFNNNNGLCVSSSRSFLSVDGVATLKLHYQANPRPKKSEMIRLARDLKCTTRIVQDWFHNQQIRQKDYPTTNGSPDVHSPFPSNVQHFNGAGMSGAIVPYRPMAERSRDSSTDDQPLDLSVKVKPKWEDVDPLVNRRLPFDEEEGEALNLSQRSSRHSTSSPPYIGHHQHHQYQVESSSPQHSNQSLLYKYMQMGTPPAIREKSSAMDHPPMERPSSVERSPSRADHPQSIPSPGSLSYADHSSSPSGTTGSFGHVDEPTDGNPYSPPNKKMRLWNQGEGDESTLEESPEAEEDSSGGKLRKSWKLHKVESEEGMYACDQCDKMFSKQSSLARHKYEHSGQRPHKCDVCNKAFKHKHHLTEHKRLHSGEKPFQCKKCLKRFSHSGSYSQHMNHRYSYCKPYHE